MTVRCEPVLSGSPSSCVLLFLFTCFSILRRDLTQKHNLLSLSSKILQSSFVSPSTDGENSLNSFTNTFPGHMRCYSLKLDTIWSLPFNRPDLHSYLFYNRASIHKDLHLQNKVLFQFSLVGLVLLSERQITSLLNGRLPASKSIKLTSSTSTLFGTT